MPTPKNNPDLLIEWEALQRKMTQAGVPSRRKIYAGIAEKYSVGQTTVRYWLDPGFRHYLAMYNRRRPPRPRRHLKPERRAYNRDYHRLIRKLPNLLLNVLHEGEKLNLEQIADRLASETERNHKVGRNIRLNCRTLKKYLQSYLNHPARAPPIYEAEPGVYTLKK